MRLFIDLATSRTPHEPLLGPLRLRKGKKYDEIEWATGRRLPCFVLYRLPVTSSMSALAACCGNAFDAALAATTGNNKLLKEVAQHWGVLARLLLNGQEGDLSDRGLVRIVDPDDRVKKSFVATTLEGDYRNAQNLRQAVVRVIEGSAMCAAQGHDAASIRPRIAALIAPPNDFHQIDQLLHTLSYDFPLGDLESMLDRP